MNRGPLVFLGIFFTLAMSWCGMVLAPQLQIGRQQSVALKPSGTLYPPARPGLANQGREVYRANGCQYCHTQQVQPTGADFARGWGKRFSVAQDYVNEYPVMLGSLRLGPDLANLGTRRADDQTGTDLILELRPSNPQPLARPSSLPPYPSLVAAEEPKPGAVTKPHTLWHLQHLYNPQITSPGSVMPSYAYLFEKRRIARGQSRSTEALDLPEKFAPGAGYEIVPKPETKALVAYLFSLSAEASLAEAPLPLPPKTEGDTNAPAGAVTNTPAK